jgi:hypothetical protein
MDIRHYLNTTFPGLVLKPSLYNQWDVGIHFEFAQGMYQFKDDATLNLDMFDRVYSQGLAIFNHLFQEQDEIFIVTNVYRRKDMNRRTKRFKIYKPFIKNKELMFRLRQETLPYVFDDEEDAQDYCTAQFSLKCCKQDIRFSSLIKATCNEDFPLKPRFRKEKSAYYPDVFFINVSKNIIFFIYDDRGCEVISTNKETLRQVYKQFNGWIAKYDREKMEKLFD